MTARLLEASSENAFQTTLNGTLDNVATTVTLTSTTNLIAPGVLVIDRQDGSGNDTPSLREYVTFTGISGNDITGVTRGVAGSTAQSHGSGALVEAVVSVTHWGDLVDFLQVEHDAAGLHVISTATVNYVETHRLALKSIASGARIETNNLVVASLASISIEFVRTRLNVSGASVDGILTGLHPTWVIGGTVSLVTTSVGKPLPVPLGGTWQFFSAVVRTPVSGSSLVLDVNRNNTSIFEAGTRPSILGGGTFVSTASINTRGFNAGDIFAVDIDNGGGTAADLTIVGRGA